MKKMLYACIMLAISFGIQAADKRLFAFNNAKKLDASNLYASIKWNLPGLVQAKKSGDYQVYDQQVNQLHLAISMLKELDISGREIEETIIGRIPEDEQADFLKIMEQHKD